MAVLDWTTNAYPRARTNRRAAATPAAEEFLAEAPPPPRGFPWAFHLSEAGNNQRGTVGSRRIIGPALLKRITAELAQPFDAGDKLPLVQVFYSSTPIAEGSDQAETFPTGATNILESVFRRNDVALLNPGQAGLSYAVGSATAIFRDQVLDYYVPLTEFYIGISVISRANAGGSDAAGVLLIYENVQGDAWRALLG